MLESLRARMAWWMLPKAAKSEPATSYQFVNGKNAPKRNTDALLEAYKSSPPVRSVVSRIAEHVAAVPLKFYVRRGKSGKAKQTRIGEIPDFKARQAELRTLKLQGELEEVESNPILDLVNKPNPQMSGFAFRRLCQIYIDVVGEAFWLLGRDGLGVPSQLWTVPPSWVKEIPGAKKSTYTVRPTGANADLIYQPEDVVYFRDLDPCNPFGRGSGVAESLGDEIDTAEYAARYSKNFFFNSGKPDLIISVEGMSASDAKASKEKFEQEHRGFWRAFRSHWIGGKVDVKELNTRFDQMGVIELSKAERDTIIQAWGVPPEVLGILTNSNRATVTEAERIMGQEVVLPRLERNRSEIQQTLVPMFDERLIAEFGSPIPVDDDFRLQSMQAAPWAATRGEWRELQGLENRGPVDDVHMVPFSLLEQGSGAKPAAADEPKAAKSHTRKDDKRDPLSAINALSADRLTSELDPLWKEKVKEWGDDALKDLGVEISFDLLNPLVTAYLEKFAADHITGKVNETTKQAIRDTLSEGVAAGEDIRNLSKRVTEVFDAARGARSIMIARTEVIGTSNFANMAAYAQSGLDLEKTWVSTPDDRVRETHADAMGQTRKLEEPFSVGGYEAQYPGDGSLPAEEIINCRCTVVAGAPGASRSIEQLTAIWKGYDARAAAWERQAIAALKRGFDKQQADVLKALEAQE